MQIAWLRRTSAMKSLSLGRRFLQATPARPSPVVCSRLLHATPARASLVDCSRVEVKPDAHGGAGAYATVDIAAGDVVETGIVRVLTEVDGNVNPYVFTWSDERPNKVWASGSGCSMFYNTGEDPNTHMERDFENNSFIITATKDISAGDELLHVYKSLTWRKCFADLSAPVSGY